MKKQPQQPNMDEWLLDSMHGLNEGDEQNIHHHFKRSDFLTALTYEYVSATYSKRMPYWLEKQIKRVISRSIWPRILVIRCRLFIYSPLPLIEDGHWKLIDEILTQTRLALQYLGFTMHGLRLLINIAVALEILISEGFALEGVQQHIAHTWFELCNDMIWVISALTPTTYLAVSCLLMVLELGLIAIRAWIEINRLSSFNAAFNNALENPELDPDKIAELSRLQAHIEAMLTHTYKKFVLNFSVTLTTTALFILKVMIIPSILMTLATNPVVPFIFSALALTITIANHFISQHLDDDKPKIKLECLSEKRPLAYTQSFFKIHTGATRDVNHILAPLRSP
jgi:hypothetical protein